MIQTATNRMVNVVSTSSMAIALSVAGEQVCAAFLNGAIVVATVGNRDAGRQLLVHSCPAFALAITHSGAADDNSRGNDVIMFSFNRRTRLLWRLRRPLHIYERVRELQ